MDTIKRLCAIVILAFAGISCSDSTGPDDNEKTGGLTQLASETVGITGGTVTAGTITLMVPSGALAEDAVISISETDEAPFGENAASDTYLVTGIPADFAAPITLTLTSNGQLTNETFIVVEESAVDQLTGGTITAPRFFPATVSGDSVSIILPARTRTAGKESSDTDAQNLLELYLTIVTDYSSAATASHFDINVPARYESFFTGLTPHLDDVYERIDDLGFDFSLPGNVMGDLDTIRVYTESDEIIDPPVFENIMLLDPPLFLMEVQREFCYTSGLEAVKFDMARSMATLTAYYYSKQDRRPTIWFDFAMSDWFAGKWYNPGNIPSSVMNDPVLALSGIPAGPLSTHDEAQAYITHSRRFLPLFSYLDSRFNFAGSEHTLARIYEERYNGSDLATSIKTATGLDPVKWWPDFLQAYLTGQVDQVDPAVFTAGSALAGQVTLSAADTSHVFSSEFGDIAADIYKITLDAEYAQNLGTLTFATESSGLQDEYLELLLFGIKDGEPSYIGRGFNSVIADFDGTSDTNTYLAVVASCLLEYPYHSNTPYTLEVTGAKDTNSFYQIVVQLPYVSRDYEWVDNDGTISYAGGAGGMFSWTINVEDMVQVGNTYTGDVVTTMNSYTWGHYTKTATISATITPTEASASVTQITEDYETDTTTTQTFEIWGLPRIEPVDIFTVSYGTTTEQYLANLIWPNFTYTYHREKNTNPDGYTRQTTYSSRGGNIHLR